MDRDNFTNAAAAAAGVMVKKIFGSTHRCLTQSVQVIEFSGCQRPVTCGCMFCYWLSLGTFEYACMCISLSAAESLKPKQ